MCAFCNQSIITNAKHKLPDKNTIIGITNEYLKFKGKRKPVQLAFFGGNFLGLDPEYIVMALDIAAELKCNNKIDSIRFSTRPDTISDKTLDMIKNFPVSTIELGVQSMNNKVLAAALRGHTAESTINATLLLKKYELEIGMQMMVGLPEDTDKSAMETARKILELTPDFIRIYPLIVLQGSLMAKWYKSGRYEPLSIDECVSLVKKIYLLFNDQSIPVIRMGLQASELLQDNNYMIAGPWHPAFGHLVLSEIFFDRAKELIQKNIAMDPDNTTITLKIHPSSESRLRGDKNMNIKALKNIFTNFDIIIKTDITLNKEFITA